MMLYGIPKSAILFDGITRWNKPEGFIYLRSIERNFYQVFDIPVGPEDFMAADIPTIAKGSYLHRSLTIGSQVIFRMTDQGQGCRNLLTGHS